MIGLLVTGLGLAAIGCAKGEKELAIGGVIAGFGANLLAKELSNDVVKS